MVGFHFEGYQKFVKSNSLKLRMLGFQKETPFPKGHFQVPILIFGGVRFGFLCLKGRFGYL